MQENNYFTLFDLETRFDIDLHALESSYIGLQKHAGLVLSYDINKAYNILKSDISRGNYILTLFGKSLKSMDPNFLEETLKLYDGVSQGNLSSIALVKKFVSKLKLEMNGNLDHHNIDFFAECFAKFLYYSRIHV